MRNKGLMVAMAKFLVVLVVGMFLASQFTGKSIAQMRREGGIFKSVENTVQAEQDEMVGRLLDDFMSY